MELKLLSHHKLSSKLCVNFAIQWSEDDRFYIISESGITIIELKGQPSNVFPTFACKNYYLEASKFIPCEELNIDLNTFFLHLPRLDLYETICRIELSGNVTSIPGISTNVVSAQWSPKNLIKGEFCSLAVLTNVYALEVYVKNSDVNEIVEYKSVLNISKIIIEYVKKDWKGVDNLTTVNRLNELKKRVDDVSISGFCWGSMLSLEGKLYCTLYVGHINGTITIFRIAQIDRFKCHDVDIKMLGRYKSNLHRISSMFWYENGDFEGELLFGNAEGRVAMVHVSDLNNERVNCQEEMCIWPEIDKILVDKIDMISVGSNSFILIVKQNFLIIFAINEDGDIVDKKVTQISNFYICGVIHFGEGVLLVLTLTGLFKKLKLIVRYNRIHVEDESIALPIDLSRQRLHGLVMSRNKVFCNILSSPCQSRDITRGRYFINLYICHNTQVDPFKILWKNNDDSLRSYWDCFEALRLLTLKEKKFPWEGLNLNLNYDKLSLKQLKILRILSKMSEALNSTVLCVDTSDIKPYIIMQYLVKIKLAVNRINKLLNMHSNGITLTKFQMRSIDVQLFFLKEMIAQDILAKANVGTNVIDEIYHVISIGNELQYPDMPQCYWCGEKIIGPSCIPPHIDSRCSISMMPMWMIPGYKCSFCKCLVHRDIENETNEMICPYCDIPLDKKCLEKQNDARKNENGMETDICCLSYMDSNRLSSLTNSAPPEIVKSDCSDDCLKECEDAIELEDLDYEIVLYSDSENEEMEDLKEAYENLQKLTI